MLQVALESLPLPLCLPVHLLPIQEFLWLLFLKNIASLPLMSMVKPSLLPWKQMGPIWPACMIIAHVQHPQS